MTPYYQDDAITIFHGDALNVLPNLYGIGAVLTDPPYSSGGAFRSDRTQRTLAKYVNSDSSGQARLPDFTGDNRDQRGFLAWSTLWLCAARHACTPGAPALVFSDWRQVPTLTDAVQAGGWIWRGLETWWKPGIRMQRGQFSSSSEFVVFGTNGLVIDHDGAPQSVFSCPPVATEDKVHIAEKPRPVMEWLLRAVPPGAVILDPFIGSGTTLRAAKDAGFRSIGIDMDEQCCEIAAERARQETLGLGIS